jgi:hypothetical protein
LRSGFFNMSSLTFRISPSRIIFSRWYPFSMAACRVRVAHNKAMIMTYRFLISAIRVKIVLGVIQKSGPTLYFKLNHSYPRYFINSKP